MQVKDIYLFRDNIASPGLGALVAFGSFKVIKNRNSSPIKKMIATILFVGSTYFCLTETFRLIRMQFCIKDNLPLFFKNFGFTFESYMCAKNYCGMNLPCALKK
ncbi:MAG: hypothetical protein JXA94_04050 [Parachlamydiales bacterium]|nr:hypothetical protein [Parachlamydiales bacterium]